VEFQAKPATAKHINQYHVIIKQQFSVSELTTKLLITVLRVTQLRTIYKCCIENSANLRQRVDVFEVRKSQVHCKEFPRIKFFLMNSSTTKVTPSSSYILLSSLTTRFIAPSHSHLLCVTDKISPSKRRLVTNSLQKKLSVMYFLFFFFTLNYRSTR
jgi:hypothetical protein